MVFRRTANVPVFPALLLAEGGQLEQQPNYCQLFSSVHRIHTPAHLKERIREFAKGDKISKNIVAEIMYC
jgi:hypothetical protein